MVLTAKNRQISCATRPLAGQLECGDRCGWWHSAERLVMAVADGLGHGPQAAYAAEAAIACIAARVERSFDEIFADCDARLRDTRGVALAVAVVEFATDRLLMASVGNIRAVLLDARRERHLGSARGIVGGGYARLTPEIHTLEPGDVLALYSDGLDEFFALRQTLEESAASPEGSASSVLDSWARGNDDAAVLIYRHPG
ncbi:MAG: SpoIIE family protein phosphatase [Candidatus Accumulibacter sp. UW20]|jgi:negative regulator of sigma-B (phosphoserine phosphatase)